MAMAPVDGTEAVILLQRAGVAMYQAKRDLSIISEVGLSPERLILEMTACRALTAQGRAPSEVVDG